MASSSRVLAAAVADNDIELFVFDSDSELADGDNDIEFDLCDETNNSDLEEQCSVTNPPPKRRKKVSSTGNSLPASESYRWASDSFVPIVHEFDSVNSGIKNNNLKDDSSEVDFFLALLPESFVTVICNETNAYRSRVVAEFPLSPHSRMKAWVDVNFQEMYCFLALTMLMPRIKKLTISEYWTVYNLYTPIFSETMSRNRYLNILSALHFSSETRENNTDKLYKIKPFLDHLRSIFPNNFSPFSNLCIDESIVVFKGRLAFKQFMPLKRHRFGIKLFILCDTETDYVLDIIVYVGCGTEIEDLYNLGVSGAFVTTLLKDYIGKGHSVFLDNWYSSPSLFQVLHKNKINACGTVRKNRKQMPKFTKRLNKGETESYHTENMMAVSWMDKREVTMLTTMHEDVQVNVTGRSLSRGPIRKPLCVDVYNQNMGAVDKTDMLLCNLQCMRKTIKWYKKLAFHFIDIILLNSYSLYKIKTGKNVPLAKFQLSVVHQLLERYHTPKMKPKGGRPSTSVDTPLRLTQRHFPGLVPATIKKQNPTRQCYVCNNTTDKDRKKRRETRYMCVECNVALCVHPCFGNYHTKKNF